MRSLLFFWALGLAFNLSAQDFRLVEPDMAIMDRKMKAAGHRFEKGYLYLQHYYKAEGKMDSVQTMESRKGEEVICAFYQEFFPAIRYWQKACSFYGKYVFYEFADARMDEVKKWVEAIYGTERNKWFSDTRYEPISQEGGCYVQIEKLDNLIQVRVHCGD